MKIYKTRQEAIIEARASYVFNEAAVLRIVKNGETIGWTFTTLEEASAREGYDIYDIHGLIINGCLFENKSERSEYPYIKDWSPEEVKQSCVFPHQGACLRGNL